MHLVLVPAALYILLHVAGLWAFQYLWGTHLLAYYSLPTQLLCALCAGAALYIAYHPHYSQQLDQRLAALFTRLAPRFSTPFKWALCLSIIPLCYAFKVDIHLMGDGQAWLAYLENAQRGFPRTPPGWIRGFPFAGLDWIHPLEPLDFWLHQLLYRFGRNYLGWQSADTAYTWASCIWGGVYALGIWKLSGLLDLERLNRYALLALLATSGHVQLFFGYAESYVSLAAVCALYVWLALRCLRAGSLLGPALALLLATALHLMAIALAPSLFYLLWQRCEKLRALLKKPRAYLPLVALAAPFLTWAYWRFYAGRHLTLLQVAHLGEYPLLSLPHAANLANAMLLVAPFGFFWALSAFKHRQHWTPPTLFAAWASVGTAALIGVHATDFAARDWDLLSLPALFSLLWSFLALQHHPLAPTLNRALRWGALPILLLHTALWIGINADKERAVARVGDTLEHWPNQPLHFQYYYRGYYQLEICGEPLQAIPLFARAAELAPPNLIGPDRITYRSSYLRLLGYAQAEAGLLPEAIATFAAAYPPDALPVFSQTDSAFHYRWVMAYLALAQERAALGEKLAARDLRQRAVAYSRHQLKVTPNAHLHYALAIGLEQLGRQSEAKAALRAGLKMESIDTALRAAMNAHLEQLP